MTTNWKNNFEERRELVLATSSKDGKPNANVVISLGFVDGKLLIADCLMETTINNLKNNPEVCVVSGYFKIKGAAQIFYSGKYFDLCVAKSAAESPDKVKSAILVEIYNIFDLDKAVIINDTGI